MKRPITEARLAEIEARMAASAQSTENASGDQVTVDADDVDVVEALRIALDALREIDDHPGIGISALVAGDALQRITEPDPSG